MKFIKPEIKATKDGSQTLFVTEFDEGYHSWHGAVQESMHVFIGAGLNVKLLDAAPIRVFELGHGTGLNAYLTAEAAIEKQLKIEYTGIEKFPVDPEVLVKLNYNELEGHAAHQGLFEKIVRAEWNQNIEITPEFFQCKISGDFLTYDPKLDYFDVFYFDAFGFRAQSELWSKEVFIRCFEMLKPGGVLVTYAAKGVVRRTMEEVGFTVERLPGAPGKREMMRATKP